MDRVLRGLRQGRDRRPARTRARRKWKACPLRVEPLEDRTLLDATLQAITLASVAPPSVSLFAGADLIHAYTRRQAIEDGVLIDVTPTAKEVGIAFPTALTRPVWERFVRVPAGLHAQDESGRLWDLALILRCAIHLSPGGNPVHFYLHVRNDNQAAKRHLLKAVCGPDDDGSPCLMVMLPTED
jgi:hypothetical protein